MLFKVLSPSNGPMGSPALMITSSAWLFDLSMQDDELLPFFWDFFRNYRIE
jgi:hypothetical protein